MTRFLDFAHAENKESVCDAKVAEPSPNGKKAKVSPLKTQGELEAEVSTGITRFKQEYFGRGPKDVHSYLVGEQLLVVRMQGILTIAEQQLVTSLPPEKGRDLLKQVRTQLIETARPKLTELIENVMGVLVLSLHHDISTSTGEEVIIFTLVSSPSFRIAAKK